MFKISWAYLNTNNNAKDICFRQCTIKKNYFCFWKVTKQLISQHILKKFVWNNYVQLYRCERKTNSEEKEFVNTSWKGNSIYEVNKIEENQTNELVFTLNF